MAMLLAIFNAGCSVFGIRNYEMPEYQVVLKEDGKEIRHYAPYIVAKTMVKGDFKEAQGAAFRILAGYIFGDNVKRQKIPMTAPVLQKTTEESEKLPMTAPVLQSPSDEGWEMSFIMPSTYTMEDLPTPKDERIRFETIPERYIAALRYTWVGNKDRNEKKAGELQQWITGLNDFEAVSLPVYAGYDPPWTLPFLRRNEVMIEVKENKHRTRS